MRNTVIEDFKRRIRETRHERNRAATALGDLEEELKRACPHHEILESDFAPAGVIFGTRPPFRVCTCCGLAEEQWSCGPAVLRYASRRVDRETAWAFIVTKLLDNKDAHDRKKELGL